MGKMRRILLPTCILSLAFSAALAQDVMTVAGGAEAHKVLLDNDQVRVLDARLQPGQKIAMHSHPANVVYFVSDCKIDVTSPDGKTTLRDGKAGIALWYGPLTHAVENAGTAECHLVQTEIKRTDK
jgi:quercetin dioxygenase-like cupin family protein